MSRSELSNLIWSVVDLLLGDYRQSKYYRVIFAFTVLHSLEFVQLPNMWGVCQSPRIDVGNHAKLGQKMAVCAGSHSFLSIAVVG